MADYNFDVHGLGRNFQNASVTADDWTNSFTISFDAGGGKRLSIDIDMVYGNMTWEQAIADYMSTLADMSSAKCMESDETLAKHLLHIETSLYSPDFWNALLKEVADKVKAEYEEGEEYSLLHVITDLFHVVYRATVYDHRLCSWICGEFEDEESLDLEDELDHLLDDSMVEDEDDCMTA
jgi:hypothetical protein